MSEKSCIIHSRDTDYVKEEKKYAQFTRFRCLNVRAFYWSGKHFFFFILPIMDRLNVRINETLSWYRISYLYPLHLALNTDSSSLRCQSNVWSSYETNKSQNQTIRSDVKCKVQIWNRSLYNGEVIKISVKKKKRR